MALSRVTKQNKELDLMKHDKKVALCLHGYFDSQQDGSSKGLDGYKHLLNRVYSKCEPDVFIHSWQPELADQINELYKPKAFLYQPQIDFVEHAASRDLYSLPEACPPMRRTPTVIMSHFYSIQKAFELCYQSGEQYDIVIKARFDIGRINRNPDAIPVQCITFDPTLDMSTVKMADWNMFDQGPADMWFYSGQKTMSKFVEIFFDLMDEFYLQSDFHKWVQEQRCFNVNDLSNAVAFYHWWFKKHNLWDTKDALECEFE